ncbi:hypothetical protein H4R35_003884 [Dimargaris xerosporica]|nr:hypothetical protein H4R35_003884 [Dimargaris xerosporica]
MDGSGYGHSLPHGHSHGLPAGHGHHPTATAPPQPPHTVSQSVMGNTPLPAHPHPHAAASTPYTMPRSYPAPPGGGLPPPATLLSPPLATATPPVPAAPSPSAAAARPLNVRDALSYLDQVKMQFQDRPEVYNQFLDIMKEFKSHDIETPDVIRRVSDLFRGHPALIQGFNTFLPPGYHIDSNGVQMDSNYARVATPSNPVATSRDNAAPHSSAHSLGVQPARGDPMAAAPSSAAYGQGYYGNSGPMYGRAPPTDLGGPHPHPSSVPGGGTVPSHLPPPRSTSPTGGAHHPTGMSGPPAQKYSPSVKHEPPPPTAGYSASSISATSSMPGMNAQGQAYRKTPLEFGHAINYVNKIKTRFANQPEQYKQFLEILHTYQRESKPIHEVYAQVQTLFKSSPDLLEEFKQFLPEPHHLTPHQPGSPPPAAGHGPVPAGPSTDDRGTRMPPVGDFGPSGQVAPDAYNAPATVPVAGTGGADLGAVPKAGSGGAPGSVGRKKRGNQPAAAASSVLAKKRPRTHGKRDSMPPIDTMGYINGAAVMDTGVSSKVPFTDDELELFSLIRRYIGHKGTYNEFLKMLNLYNEEILDEKALVERIAPVLAASDELFSRFKALIGYKEPDAPSKQLAPPRKRLDLANLKEHGSYRLLPLDVTKDRCSGRDDLCREVLNDHWVSHPKWSSEEDGFTSHKKNSAEEGLHKCEEERYEFDLNIDSNLSTIALLEPIARQIDELSPEDKVKFRLTPEAFGESQAIYRRVLKKVYGDERGLEVADHLHHNPVMAIPVVLKRLKQKDEEWRKLRRVQNRIWREMDVKNFYRSLDYQTVTGRYGERRQWSAKTLIAEIEKLRKDSLAGHGAVGLIHSHRPRTTPVSAPGAGEPTSPRASAHTYPPSYHMEFTFSDPELVRDAIRLYMDYYEKSAGSGMPDRTKLEQLLDHFLQPFLQAADPTPPTDSANAEQTSPTPTSPLVAASVAMDTDEPTVKPDPSITEGATNDPSAHMATAGETTPSAKGKASPTHATAHTWIHMQPVTSSVSPTPALPPSEPGLDGAPVTGLAHSVADIRWNTFYANSTFYVFFRHFQLVYHRLHRAKQAAPACAQEMAMVLEAESPARHLDLFYKPEVFEDIDLSKVDFFQLFLNLVDRYFDGELEQSVFDEAMRYLYRTHACNLIGLDKLISTSLKHINTLTSDSRFDDLLLVYDEMRTHSMASVRQQILYRMKVESVIGTDEHLYRIEFLPPPFPRTCTIQLLLKDDFTLSHAVTSEEKWAYYVDSFVLLAPTEGVSFEGQYPFLRRNLPREAPAAETASPEVLSHSGLEIKIALNTYKICFVTHSEDFFMKRSRPMMLQCITGTPATTNDAKAAPSTVMDVDIKPDPEASITNDTLKTAPAEPTATDPTDRFTTTLRLLNQAKSAKWRQWLEANTAVATTE